MVFIIVLTIPYCRDLLSVVFFPENKSMLSQLEVYKWVALGMVLYALVRPHIRKNLLFVETFSHEFTHFIVALLFNKRMHSFHAEQGSGAIFTSGRHKSSLVPIALAPYCLPVFTYLLLSFRWMLNFHGAWIFDIIIGITICFHFYCFKTQIGNHQTDINQYPLSFSYLYIFTAWLINLCIILPSFFPNMNGQGNLRPLYHYGMWSSIYRLGTAWVENFMAFF